MRAWVNGQLLDTRGRPGGRGDGPRLHRRRRGVRGGEGGRRAAVRADPPPRPAGPVRDGPRPARLRRGRGTTRGGGGPRRSGAAAGAHPDHLHRGSGPARLRPRRQPADARGRRGRHGGLGGADVGGHGAVAAQRAGRARGTQDDVVRRERRRPGLRRRAWRQRGDLRQHRRQPVRGHRLQRLLRASTASCARRRWRPAAWPGSAARWCSSGTAAARSTSRSTCSAAASEVFLVSTTRDVQAVRACDGRELPAPGPVTARGGAYLAAQGGARTSTRDRSSPSALASGDGASARRLRAAALAVGRDVQPVPAGARVAVALGAVAGEVHEDLVAVGGLAGAEAVALAE